MIGVIFLFATLLLLALWVFLFLRTPETRVEMVLIGTIASLFTPIFLLFHTSAIEEAASFGIARLQTLDFVFSFLFAGCAAVFFQSVFNKAYKPIKTKKSKPSSIKDRWPLYVFFIMVIWVWVTLFVTLAMNLSTVQAVIVSSLLVGSYMVIERRDLLWNAVWSGLLMGGTLFVLYELAFVRFSADLHPDIWTSAGLGPRMIDAVPVDALLWAVSVGFVLGPLYEFARNIQLVPET